jgi:hypothetical protein
MLDDFKTELKRLGIKRIQKEEARRQSFALVLDDKDDLDEDRELEFSDALNTNQARFHGKKFRGKSNATNSTNSPPRRLRHESMELNGSAEKRGGAKDAFGRGGTKIGKLPGLKSFGFDAIKPGKKGKDDIDDDDEDESPTAAGAVGPTDKSDLDGRTEVGSSTEGPSKDQHDFDSMDFQTKPAGL